MSIEARPRGWWCHTRDGWHAWKAARNDLGPDILLPPYAVDWYQQGRMK